MTKKKTLVELLNEAAFETQIGRMPDSKDPLHPYAIPSRRRLGRHSDEELAELIVDQPATTEAELARSILRRRESWRTPATPALIISVLSFVIAAAAFARTL